MSDNAGQRAVIFGGFRTETLKESQAAASFLDACGLDQSAVLANVWNGAADSLQSRHERSLQWLSTELVHGGILHILGYSMGCQLAVKFAQTVLDHADGRTDLGSVTLVAPDPQFRRGHQDFVERQQGITSAYDEARDLWSVGDSAGPKFVEALRCVANACEYGCRIVFCKDDGVAEWADNVELMSMQLKDCAAIRWVETKVNEVTHACGVRFRLDPDDVSHIACADRTHAALWYRLNFEALTGAGSQH